MFGTVIQYVVPAVIGLISGAIGSLIAPWISWGIEKRKLRLHARREFITDARRAVTETEEMSVFRESAVYSRLRPHLSERTREFIEQPGNKITFVMGGGRGGGANNYASRVLDDIHKLEMKWGLL